MSTSGFVIAGDNVQAASILLSRFPYCFQGFHTLFKVSILLSRFLSFHELCFSKFVATENNSHRQKQNKNNKSKDKNKIKTQESERREKDSGRAAEVEGVWDPGGKLLCFHVCLLWKRFSSHTIYFQQFLVI